MPSTWYFVRHAEKEKGGYFNSHLRHQDEPISAAGRQQAERLCAFFDGKPVEQIFVSEYVRTAQTAAPVARQLGLDPIVDARLNEMDNGRLDGMADEDVRREYPEVWAAFRARTADFRFPEGETGEEVRQRVAGLLDETLGLPGQGGVLCVAHDGLIRILMCHVLRLPVTRRWDFRIDFCGIVELAYQPEFASWKLVRFNHTC
jgi:broad specificity phosphatase PhoE